MRTVWLVLLAALGCMLSSSDTPPDIPLYVYSDIHTPSEIAHGVKLRLHRGSSRNC